MLMLLIDGHEDLAYNAVDLGRELTVPVTAIRAREGAPPPHGEGTATVSLPALREAGARMVLATIFAHPAVDNAAGHRHRYSTPEEALRLASAQIDYYHRLAEQGEVTILHDQRSLHAALAGDCPLPGVSLLLEGADPLRAPADLGNFVARGVRTIGLAWKATRYAGGAGAAGPLTEAGRELLREMDRLGVTLDASHLAEEAFWQALRCFHGRVIASHANCRAIVPGDRQFSDEMIRAIADRDGVIGLVFYNRFIVPGWSSARGKDAVSLRDLLPHVAHLVNIAGIRHIGLGSDLDGGIGREDIPREIDTIADLPRFADTLAEAGYSQQDIEAIMGKNWLRYLRAILPK